MAYILNLETATYICSVSLALNGKFVDAIETREPRSHASRTTLMIEELLKKHALSFEDLSAVAVSSGPGSYTGLRIGTSMAKGLCYALDKPLIQVNTLASMAVGMSDMMVAEESELPKLICPMIDARRMEVFQAIYTYPETTIFQNEHPKILDETSYLDVLADSLVYFAGTGSSKWEQLCSHQNARFISDFNCSAKFMSALSFNNYATEQFDPIATIQPNYLKPFQS